MKKHKTLIIIILSALILRVILYLQIKDHFLFNVPILDAKYYHDWAIEIANGNFMGIQRGVFMMSPGYSYFLGIVYKIFGVNISIAVFLQFIMSLIVSVLLYLISIKYFSKKSALIASALYLFYGPGIFYETALLKATLINLLNITAVYIILEKRRYSCLLAGILIGLSAHLRPNVLLYVPVLLIYFFYAKDRILKKSSLLIMGVFLALAPVGVRNYIVGKQFVFTTAHGGMNFFTGNSSYCLGPYTPMPFARTDPEVEQSDFLEEASRRSGRKLSSSESSSFWYKESLKFIANNPGSYLLLLGKKVFIFVNNHEPSINLDYYFFKAEYNSVLSFPLFSFGLLFPLSVLGLMLCSKDEYKAQLPILGYVGVYVVSNIMFFVVSEYRFPVVPILCIYAGASIEKVLKMIYSGERKKISKFIIIASLIAFASNYDIYSKVFGFKYYHRSNRANAYFGLGVTYESENLSDKAIESYVKALNTMPQSAPLVNMANIYEERGESMRAMEYNKRAIAINPNSEEAYNNLAGLYYKSGQYEIARRLYMKALELNPGFPEAKKNLKITIDTIKRQNERK